MTEEALHARAHDMYMHAAEEILDTFERAADENASDDVLAAIGKVAVIIAPCPCPLVTLTAELAARAGRVLRGNNDDRTLVGIDHETVAEAGDLQVLALRLAVAAANGDPDTAEALMLASPIAGGGRDEIHAVIAAQLFLLAGTITGRGVESRIEAYKA